MLSDVSAPRRRIVIADDRAPARAGLRAVLSTMLPDVEIVAEAADGQEAVLLVGARHPRAVVLDIRMPGMDGLEATRIIKSRWPTVAVVVVSMHTERELEALAAGADAFVSKLDPPHALICALQAVMT
jgi:DNA-binding NarL/FixJ family response regulator